MSESLVRKARPGDVPAIHTLINDASKTMPVIRRSHYEIYGMLRDFFVYDSGDGVKGCCALHITWHDLAEVKSLVVDPDLRAKGIGRALVEACIEEARTIMLPRVFALTNVPGFFGKLGFAQIDKHELPHKIWGECIHCSKFPDCDEVPVQLLTGVEAVPGGPTLPSFM
jgi:amino-acid N-acetyltransferase